MKKVIGIFLVVFILFFSFCKKDQSCYKCKTTFTIHVIESGDTSSFSVASTQTVCDMTETEIREYERDNSDTLTYTNGSVTFDTIFVTVCTK